MSQAKPDSERIAEAVHEATAAAAQEILTGLGINGIEHDCDTLKYMIEKYVMELVEEVWGDDDEQT